MGRLTARLWRQAAVVAVVGATLAIGPSSAEPANDWTFVQVQRVNSLTLQYGTDTFATQNAFGAAIPNSAARSSLQTSLDQGVKDGSITQLLEMPGLTDLTGTNNGSFSVGVVGGTPVAPGGNPATYDGSSDLDWWYTPDAAGLQPDGTPTTQVPASFTAGVFSAGPAALKLTILFSGTPVILDMSNAQIQANTGASSAPLKSTNGFPPGHEPAENLPDSLTSFAAMSSGQLKGRISAKSLYDVPLPSAFTGGNCTNGYTTSNNLLDLFVAGCSYGGLITFVSPTQPDTVTSTGSGSYVFTLDGTHHVTGCTHNGGAATLSDCLTQAAYSSYFHFTTDRVIDRNQVKLGQLLSVTRAGTGTGSVSSAPAGIDCGTSCSHGFLPGTQVTLTATPATGSTFSGWSGAGCSGTGTCTVTMDAAKAVQATFDVVPAGPTDVPPPGGGGGGATPTGQGTPTPPDTTPPRLTSATIAPRKVKKSATVTFSASEPARVTFVFETVAPGRRVGSKCVKPTRANARKKACGRFLPAAQLAMSAVQGVNRQVFSTRIGKRTLKPGSYRLTLVAKDAAGNASAPTRLTFVVKK